jgi:hypothetical protein
MCAAVLAMVHGVLLLIEGVMTLVNNAKLNTI